MIGLIKGNTWSLDYSSDEHYIFQLRISALNPVSSWVFVVACNQKG